jgi:hypothetical protein
MAVARRPRKFTNSTGVSTRSPAVAQRATAAGCEQELNLLPLIVSQQLCRSHQKPPLLPAIVVIGPTRMAFDPVREAHDIVRTSRLGTQCSRGLVFLRSFRSTSMRRAVRWVQKSPSRTDTTVQQGCKTFGNSVLQAISDKSLNASSKELLLHLPSLFYVRFSHDRCDVVGDNRLAKAREQRASFGRRCRNCFFDVHCGAPHRT